MNKSLTLLAFSLLFAAANAQIAIFDTSIIKNGNTWVYKTTSSSSGSGGFFNFSGTTRYTVDSVAIAFDTLKFSVTQADSAGTTITATSKYTFSNNTYSQIPPFAYGQAFHGLDGMAVYRGDTVRYKSVTEASGCYSSSSTNLQHVGLIRYTYSYVCGNNRTSDSQELLEFNGTNYVGSNLSVLYPSALKGLAEKRPGSTGGAKKAFLIKNRVFYVGQKGLYDTRGQAVPK